MQPFSLGALSPRSFNVAGATNATPIIIQTTAPHSFVSGDIVTGLAMTGNTGGNGSFPAQVIDSTHVLLVGSVGNGAWVSGGTVSAPRQVTFSPLDNLTTGVARIIFVPRVTNTKISYAGIIGLNQATAANVIREMNISNATGGRVDWINVESAGDDIYPLNYWIDCQLPTEQVVVAYWRR